MEDETNVNKLNGIPNFGHGLPEDGVVVAGITDVPVVEASVEKSAEAPAEVPVEAPVEAPVVEEVVAEAPVLETE